MTLGNDEPDTIQEHSLRVEVLRHCTLVYWERFPHEAFTMITVLIRRALHLDEEAAAEEELPDIGAIGVHPATRSPDVTVAVICTVVFWANLRDRLEADTSLAEEALSGLEQLVGRPLGTDAPQSADEVARLALDIAVVPLLTDALLSLCAKDPVSAIAVMPLLQGSALWRDAASCQSPGKARLDELEWYVGLCQRQEAWAAAHAELKEQLGAVGLPQVAFSYSKECVKADRRRSAAKDALLDWARPCLARDRPLLEPRPGMHTSLSDQQWEHLRQAASCRVLLLLLAVFEGEQDFDGAMHDLSVAAAQSPWLLKLLRPQQVRAFMRRLSLIPMTFGGAMGKAALGA